MGRIIVVGDRHQCQPTGTLVELTNGIRKGIEEIMVGDEVVTYDRKAAGFIGRVKAGRKVTEIASREYRGTLFTVGAGDKVTKCTDTHKWLVRFANRSLDLNVVYLIKKGDFYRVGWCQLFNSHGNLHLGVRVRLEDADCAWILSVHNNKTDASIEESRVATIYGLPLLPFSEVRGAKHLTQEALDRFFQSLPFGDHQERAKECLADFDKSHDHPFYVRNDESRQGRSTIFVTEACNLIREIMLVPVYNGERDAEWRPVTIGKKHNWRGKVHSLNVEKDHNYVADGILTKNSIYGFRGADITAIPSLVEMMQGRVNGCKEFPLSVCRRSPRSHIRLAQALVPDVQWMTEENSGVEAPEGEIYQVSVNVALDMMREGDMGIGRVNKVLIPAAYQLIRMRKKVVIRGRDIGTGLISLIKKMKAKSIEDLLYKLGKWFDKEVTKLCAKEGVSDPSMLQKGATKYQALEDKVCCIEALCDGIDTLDELIVTIEKLFSDFDDSGKPKQAIVLGTVHRTKGLEAHNITVLDPENFPHALARKSWERVQERNLAYVAATRAKFSLAKDGSVIEPGRLVFVGACPTIYKAQWLHGLNKYPNDGKPYPAAPPQQAFVPVPEEKPADPERKAMEDRLATFYQSHGVEAKIARGAVEGLTKEQLAQCVKSMEEAQAKTEKPKLTPEQERALEEEKRHEAMMRAIEEANF